MDDSDIAEMKKQIAELQKQLAKRNSDLKCSFCGKKEPQVKKLIAGPGVYICNECVDLCNDILEDEPVSVQRSEVEDNEIGKLKKENAECGGQVSVGVDSNSKNYPSAPPNTGQSCSYCGKEDLQGIHAGADIYICIACSNLRKCSFCGKRETLVKKLITGPGVYICDECVSLCNEVRDERSQQYKSQSAPQVPDTSSPIYDNPLDSAKSHLLGMVRDNEKWLISRVCDNTLGVQAVLSGRVLGSDLEEQVLFASALQALAEERLLVECHKDKTETTYQLTWKSILKLRIFEPNRSTEAVLEPGLYRLETAITELLKDVLRRSDKWTIKRILDKSDGVKLLVAEEVLGADLEEQVLFASALDTAVAQGLLVQCHCAGNDSTFQLTWSGMVEAKKHMECGIDCD